MRRIELSRVALAAAFIATAAACSKTEGNRPASSEQAAERPTAVGTGGAGADVKSNGEFVDDVAVKNMAEIELSRMALEKATSPEIKAFAQKMIDDHGVAGDSLKSVVSASSMAWPSQLDDRHRKIVDELKKARAADFERDYLKAMIEGHENLAAKLESRLDVQSLANWKTAAAGRTQSQALPDPDVSMRDVAVRPLKSGNDVTMKINQWAADTYPVAQKHLDTARTLENAIKKHSTN
jgi:putative membrane protein